MPRKIAANILFDLDQLERIDEAAAKARMSRSEWIRHAAEKVLTGQGELALDARPA